MSNISRYDPFRGLRRSFWTGFPFDDMFEELNDEGIVRVDVYEEDENVVLKADLPGFSPENVDVTVTSDSVTLKATKDEEVEEKQREYTRRERRVGSYARTVNLPSQVIADQAEAEFSDGTLTLRIPKVVEQKSDAVRVEIKKK